MVSITKKYGESVTLTATPNSGYEFSSWSGDASGSTNPLTFTVTSDRTITANFSASVQNVIRYTLTPGSAALTGSWITNNTDTSRNTYDSTTGEGVFYLLPGATISGVGFNTSPFAYSNVLTSIDFSDSGLTILGPRTCVYARNLTSIILPPGLQTIGYLCFAQAAITSIVLPNGLINIGDDAFNGCTNLTTMNIPASVTYVGNYAIPDSCCTENNKIYYLDNWAIDIKYSAVGTTSTLDIADGTIGVAGSFILRNKGTRINVPVSVRYICRKAFSNSSRLNQVVLANNSQINKIDEYVGNQSPHIGFSLGLPGPSNYGDDGRYLFQELPNIAISPYDTFYYNSISIYTEIIGESCCRDWTSLTSVSLENTKHIHYGAFKNCTGLTSIELPDTLETIGASAFSGCTNLTSVTCHAETPPALLNLSYSDIYNYEDYSDFDFFSAQGATLYVPGYSISDYENSDWAQYFSNIQAIQ